MKDKETETLKPWTDNPDKWTPEIELAHPLVTGDNATYAIALEMVGNRHSKYELVDLVNWLLTKSRPATMEARALDALENLCDCPMPADFRDARALLREAGRVK